VSLIAQILSRFHFHIIFCFLTPPPSQWRTQEFFLGRGIYTSFFWGGAGGQQIQLRIEGRENGDLGVVAPKSMVPLNLQMNETHILIRLLRMYIPRKWDYGSALAKLRNFGGGGLQPPPNHPSGTPLPLHTPYFRLYPPPIAINDNCPCPLHDLSNTNKKYTGLGLIPCPRADRWPTDIGHGSAFSRLDWTSNVPLWSHKLSVIVQGKRVIEPVISYFKLPSSQFSWPCDVKRKSEAAWLLRSRVGIPVMVVIFVSCVCCVLCR
jgi:hypothetical protein